MEHLAQCAFYLNETPSRTSVVKSELFVSLSKVPMLGMTILLVDMQQNSYSSNFGEQANRNTHVDFHIITFKHKLIAELGERDFNAFN